MSLSEKLDRFTADLKAKNRAKIHEAETIYKQSLHDVLNVQGDHEHPSKPGEAPHKVTGRLQSSIFSEVDDATLTSTTGTTAGYTKFLLPKRDYYRMAFDRVASKIRQILLNR